jgi:hypothetical protein
MSEDLTLFAELIGAIMVIAMLGLFVWITLRR